MGQEGDSKKCPLCLHSQNRYCSHNVNMCMTFFQFSIKSKNNCDCLLTVVTFPAAVTACMSVGQYFDIA